MQNILLKSLSILLWIWFLLSSVLFTPVILLLWLFTFWWDKKLSVVHLFSCFWGAQYIWINPLWKLKIVDRNKFDDSRAYVIISNHQSLADIVVIYSLFKHFRWTSKVENFRLPFVGWVLSLNRSVKVYRNHPDSYTLFKRQAEKVYSQGTSLMIFPEGTRSKDGRLNRFKEGAFFLAHDLKADILPIVLDGTSRAIPKQGWSLRGKQSMLLKVLDPVSYEEYNELTIKETRLKYQELIENELNKIRN
ncbi:MAG: lysophospholipid acyltransferase family protein [Bacteroidota bacterium]